MTFDPDAAAAHDGIFGLPTTVDEARYVVIPVPFDATTSYRDGTRNGPAAVLEASYQVDLFDVDFGRSYRHGIAMLPIDRRIVKLNREARKFAEPVIAAGGNVKNRKPLDQVNRRCEEMNRIVEETARGLLERGKVPIVLGGDHSTPFGAIRAYAAKFPGLGILHIDAHADLRAAFEGFVWSHASIMHNVVKKIRGLSTLVQVGIRDFGEAERLLIEKSTEPKIVTHFDARLHEDKFSGTPWRAIVDRVVADLPETVYLSVDIDGFDPTLCPDTGTPVPGGLSFNEFLEILRGLGRAKRKIVGFDLNEVAPCRTAKDWGSDWNANVGARVLYKMIGAAS